MKERTKGKKKRKKYNKFQRHENNMDDTSDGNSEYSDQTNNSFLKNDSHDSKKHKSQGFQRPTIQSSRKASLVDIQLKRIQPSLSEREWIINQRQRHVFQEKSKIDITKRELVYIQSLFTFFQPYSGKFFYIYNLYYISLQ